MPSQFGLGPQHNTAIKGRKKGKKKGKKEGMKEGKEGGRRGGRKKEERSKEKKKERMGGRNGGGRREKKRFSKRILAKHFLRCRDGMFLERNENSLDPRPSLHPWRKPLVLEPSIH